jgi:hypothetical protein
MAKSPASAAPTGARAITPTPETAYDKALRYTRCMNDHGEKMDDPVAGSPCP